MENKALSDVKQFIQTFIARENDLLNVKIQHEVPLIQSFIVNYTVIENNAEKLIENEAPKFNLFDILQIYHLEAKVHTPFLVALLNPEGKHRQGRLFFNAFIKHLFRSSFNPDCISHIKVSKEFSDYGNGRMDILISYREDDVHKEIVIENKIYHDDEKEQLTRYHRYLTHTRGLKEGQYHLIYLTPNREKPTSRSINPDLYNNLIQAGALTEWGYYGDIEFVLRSALPEIKAATVKYSIQQYIDAIQFL